MTVESETKLLNSIHIFFETGNGDSNVLISDLSEIIEMTSMMMSNDNMWDYCVELANNSDIWILLNLILNDTFQVNELDFTIGQLRIIKGIVLMIRNLFITIGKASKETQLKHLNLELVRNIGEKIISISKFEKNEEIILKSLDISIVCFHCMFNFMQSTHDSRNKKDIENDINLLNDILIVLQSYGDSFDMRQIMPQVKAYCMIPESRSIVVDNDCLIFRNLLKSLARVIKFDISTDIEDLKENHNEKYELLLGLSHILVYLFQDEKIGNSIYRVEKNKEPKDENMILLYLVTSQMTCSITDAELEAEWKWDYLALGSICLEFYKIYYQESIKLLECNNNWDLNKTNELNVVHRKIISVLDIITNLLPYEVFRKTLNSYNFIKDLIEFLKIIEKNTERKRLKDSTELGKDKKNFPQVKTIIIEIITHLVHSDFSNQEKVREYGGLELILNNCNLDINEPFIRERCILCLKYLLENNSGNQSFIASLEAKGMEINKDNEKVLEKCGYEIDIVDGKVKLKQQPVAIEEINEK